MGYLLKIMDAIKNADVVLFILDARMPELSSNRALEQKLKEAGKSILRVFNKIDLISRENLNELKKENKNDFFVSVADKRGIRELRLALLILAKKKGDRLKIGIVGYPNVGKSAITNILTREGKTAVSSRAGTTKGVQWANSNKFKMIDSPGVIPFEDDEVKLGILGAKNPEKLKDVESVATAVIKIFFDNCISCLEKFYGVSVNSGENEDDVMTKIGGARKLLKKGGVVDEKRVCLMIVRDWQTGKLKIE